MSIFSKWFLLLLIVTLGTSKTQTYGQSYKFASFNIKYDNTSDKVNNWTDRKQSVAQLVKYYDLSFLGIQEGLHNQVAFLDSSLTTYAFIGVGRDDGATKGEYSAIFYDSTQFKMLSSATFWLSETPSIISVGWDAAMERICTYGLFEQRDTKQQLWVFNAHFDHLGLIARKESAKLIVNKIQTVNENGLPVVLMGDFNALPDDNPIQLFNDYLDDALSISTEPLYGPVGTFNGFTDQVVDKRIDYFFTQKMAINSYAHIDDKLNNNKHLSDHLPVLIEARIESLAKRH